jgi:RHS repeat-associated protein
MTDSNNRQETYGYDPTGHFLTSYTDEYGTTMYTYVTGQSPAQNNALAQIAYADNTHTFFSYDSQGRLIDQHRDGGQEDQAWTYLNPGGYTVTDALGNKSTVYFNLLGATAETIDPLGNVTRYSFDANLNLTQVIGPGGATNRYSYDANGNVTRQTDPLGLTTNFTYGVHNNLTSYTDAKGNTTGYTYNPANDLLSITSANGTQQQYSYNPLGQATQYLNARGQAIAYAYNSQGLVKTETFPDGTSYSYTFDARGNLTSATDQQGKVESFIYDNQGNPDLLTEVDYPDGTWLKFRYNVLGQRTQSVDQTGFTVNYSYDSLGRLSELTDASGNLVVQYTYDAAGRLARKDNGNDTRTVYTYDGDGSVVTITNLAPDHVTVNSFDNYTYDPLGNVLTDTNQDGHWVYTYDADSQLIHAVFTPNSTNPDGLTAQDLQYVYDAAGNRQEEIVNGVTTTYMVNSVNEYTSSLTGGLTTTYQYDADGNLIAQTAGSAATSYAFNALNQLTTVNGLGLAASYGYDARGTLVSQTVNGATTSFQCDPSGLGNVVATFSAGGILTAHYTYGIGLVSQVGRIGTEGYYDFNNIGSTVGITGTSGTYSSKYAYLPFGQTIVIAAAISNPFTIVGQRGVQEDGAGLVNMRARSYDVLTGQFTSKDPLGLLSGTNLRRYAGNNPTRAVDPSGLKWTDWAVDAVGVAAVVGAVSTGVGLAVVATGVVNHLEPGQIQSFFQFFTDFYYLPNPYTDDRYYIYNDPRNHNYYQDAYDKVWKNHSALDSGDWVASDNVTFGADISLTGGDNGESSIQTWVASTALNLFAESGDPSVDDALMTEAVTSQDPNSIGAPAGYGTENFVAGASVLPYQINVENDPSATSPAQRVDITDALDPNLDWSTFQLTAVGFGNTYNALPAGVQHYDTTVNITENGQAFQVSVVLNLDPATGILTASFQSIDPSTGLPPASLLTGFLPPEDGSGRGIGFVSFTVRPQAGLRTGTQIRNVAQISFDGAPNIATDQVNDQDPSQGIDPNKQALVTIAEPATQLAIQAPGQAIAGGKFSVTVNAVDTYGDTDPLYNGTAALILSGGPLGGKLSGLTIAPIQHGVAVFSNLSINEVGTGYTLVAASTDDLLGAASPIAVSPPMQFRLTGLGSTDTAGGTSTITVTAVGPNGQPDTSYVGTIHFTSSDPRAVLPADYTFQPGDNGTKTFPIVLKTAGPQTVTATDITALAATGTSSVVTVSAAAQSGFQVTGLPSPDVSGVPHSFTVTAVDAFGNRITSYLGTVQFSLAGGQGTLPPPYTFTAADKGAHTFTATLRLPGSSQALTVTDTAHSGLTGTQSSITVVSPATHLAISVAPQSTTAGQQLTVIVTALNGSNLPDGSFADTLHFASSDRQAILPADQAFTGTNGTEVFTITLKTTGSPTITVTDTTRPTITAGSARVAVLAATASGFVVKGYPSAVASGAAHSFTVSAVDAFGNVSPSYQGTVQFSVTGGQASLPAAYTFKPTDQGIHTFTATLNSPGNGQSLTASDTTNSTITGTQTGINVFSPATHLLVTVNQANIVAGQPVTVTVTAFDASNHPDTQFHDRVHFSSGDQLAALAIDQAFAGTNGTETFTIIPRTARRLTLTVTDTTRPAGLPVQAGSTSITVNPAGASSLLVTAFPSVTVTGASHRFTVTAVDPFGNRVTGYRGSVQFSVTGGTQTVPPVLPSTYTFTAGDQGSHTFTATLNTVGTWSLVATDTTNASITGSEPLDVTTLTSGVAGPSVGVPGQPLTFTLTATEPGAPANAVFVYHVDWVGNGSATQSFTGPSGLTVSHVYPGTGNFTVKVTAVDAAGAASSPAAQQPVQISVIALENDPATNTNTALAIGCPAAGGTIQISPANAAGTQVTVQINGAIQQLPSQLPTHLFVFGQGAHDTINLLTAQIGGNTVTLAVPALLVGGSGTSALSAAGSSANNILIGGTGPSTLAGGTGQDFLIGGGGPAVLHAGTGGDFLLGGSTIYDANPTALEALMAEWQRTDISYQQRVQDLFGNGTGGLNGAYFLNAQTVARDLAVNQLFGGSGSDWFWFTAPRTPTDRLTGFRSVEVATFE